MSSLVATTMSPGDIIFTFKQKNEESFKEAWSRIYDWHGKTEPKMALSLHLSCFYFGLALRYRYALDATAEGDFLHCCKGKLPLSVFLVINDNPYGLMFSLRLFMKELFIGIA
jgi:hypothetical protein